MQSSHPSLAFDQQLSSDLMQAYWDSPVLVSLFDRKDILRWANPAFRKGYALSDDQVLSWSELAHHCYVNKIGALIETDDFDAWLASARSRRGTERFRAFECDLRDGRWLWMTEAVLPDGGMLCIASDITTLRRDGRDLRLERDLARRAALTDSLTGISNRAHITEQLVAQLHRVRSVDASCGIAMLDLDFFKKINDGYGHLAGDTVIRHFARFLHQVLRRGDGIGRLGGEEFLVLLPGVTANTLSDRMQKLLEALAQERPLEDQPGFVYSCSIGGTLLCSDDTMDMALQRADAALYSAKDQGRNRYVWAPV